MLVVIGVGFGLLAAFASPATAATVTSDMDTLPPEPGELRYEINNATPGETVTIAPGIDPTLDWGALLIDKSLILEGQGANQTNIVQEDDDRRIILVGSVDPTAMVTIRDLQLAGARAADGGPSSAGQSGGAIENQGVLTLNRLFFDDNRAGNGHTGANGANGDPGEPGQPGTPGGSGGAVHNTVGGDVFIFNSTFRNNHAGNGGNGGKGGNGPPGIGSIAGAGGAGGAGQDGGAISNAGDMTVTNSTFFGNGSGQGGMGGAKGDVGFAPGGDGGESGVGGAIHQAGAGSLTITNSTIAGNTASAGGAAGGIGGDPGADGSGGGTFFFVGVTVANTLYSQNTAPAGSNCSGGGTITSTGPNLAFPAGTGCPGSFLSGNPQLGPLTDNGGATQTMALGAGSAAINTGGLTGPATDQRGVSRPQGPGCDIGAFELEQATIPGSTCAGPPPASPLIPPTTTTPLATGLAKKKCKKGRKLKKGRCVKKKRKK